MAHQAGAGDIDAFFWTNVAFRDAESDICGNALVKQTLDSLGLRTLQLRHFSMSLPGRVERTLANHRQLLQAYEERDAQLAMALRRSVVYAGLRAIERSGWPGRLGDGAAAAT
jgi:DNA-binding GntR family transcriptional regulator